MNRTLLLRFVGMLVFALIGGSIAYQVGLFFVGNTPPNGIDTRLPLQLAIIFFLIGIAFGALSVASTRGVLDVYCRKLNRLSAAVPAEITRNASEWISLGVSARFIDLISTRCGMSFPLACIS